MAMLDVQRSGSWEQRWADDAPAFQQSLFSDAPGSRLDISLTGSRLTIPLLHHDWSGIVHLHINGQLAKSIDLYSPQKIVTYYLLSLPGPLSAVKQVQIELTGTTHPSSRGHQIFVGTLQDERQLPPMESNRAQALGEQITMTDGQEGRFIVLNNDNGISRVILSSGVWASRDVHLFRRLIQDGDVVFDVGANIGHHAVVFARSVGPRGKVFAFEPQLLLFNTLCANLLVNAVHNAYPYRVALGEKPGQLRMMPIDYSADESFGSVAISTKWQDPLGELVQVTTIDEVVRAEAIPRLDFIKIDVQTFELYVLRGAAETLLKLRPRLFIEISPYWTRELNDYDYRQIYYLLNDLGYDILDRDLQPIPTGGVAPPATDQEWDIVAVPANAT